MKLDVNRIEKDIYADICEEFGQFCESRLEKCRSVLDFLRYIELETVLSKKTVEVYSEYCAFCQMQNHDPLNNTYFGRVMKTCGFEKMCENLTVSGTKNRKKSFYFRLG